MNFFGMFKGSAFKTIRLFKVDRLVDLGVAISGDGRLAMVCEEGGHIGVWDPHSGKKSCTLSGLKGECIALAVSPDGQMGLSGDSSGEMRLWKLNSGTCTAAWKGHDERISCVAFAPDGRTAVSGSWDRTVKRWDLTSHECLGTLRGHPASVTSVAISPDGKLIISGGFKGAVRAFNTSGSNEGKVLPGQQSIVTCVAISRDGRRFVAGGDDGLLSVGEIPLGKLEVLDIRRPISSIALSPNGLVAICGLESGEIFNFDLVKQEGRVAVKLKGEVDHSAMGMSLSLTADGRYLLAGRASAVALFRV